MDNMQSIQTICGDVDSVAAEFVVRSVSGVCAAEAHRRLYYPYFHVELLCSTTTLLGKSRTRVSCLVDARTQAPSTSDVFELIETSVRSVDVLDTRRELAEAESAARRYAAYALRGKQKALLAPRWEITKRSVIHKPFWIVRCHHEQAGGLEVLVDGVTGGLHVLDLPSAEPAFQNSVQPSP